MESCGPSRESPSRGLSRLPASVPAGWVSRRATFRRASRASARHRRTAHTHGGYRLLSTRPALSPRGRVASRIRIVRRSIGPSGPLARGPSESRPSESGCLPIGKLIVAASVWIHGRLTNETTGRLVCCARRDDDKGPSESRARCLFF